MPVSGGVPLLLGLSRQGEIRVQKDYALDFELSPHIHLVVLAESGLQTTHCRVSIGLLDVNDNAPRFEYSSYRTAVWEGQAHNTYIMQVDSLGFLLWNRGVKATLTGVYVLLQVFASDADSGINGQIEYSIVSGDPNQAFILDSVRGILATNVLLDREITPSYK